MGTKKLFDILPKKFIVGILNEENVLIEDITLDSRQIEKGWGFIAKKGHIADGHDYINQAITLGACVIFCETLPEQRSQNIVYVQYEYPEKFIGNLAHLFFGEPSKYLTLIGITGTNGKSSVATVIYQLLMNMGKKAGLLSTIENKIGLEILGAKLTTPDSVSLNRLLGKMVDEGCECAIMEVSSHALHQGRVAGLVYDIAVFTNLTHDHLDYHGTFKEYLDAKKMLFDHLSKSAVAITNIDDRNGKIMVQNSKAKLKYYGLLNPCDYKGKILSNGIDGLYMDINDQKVNFTLSGKFNAYNLLAATAVADSLGIDFHDSLVTLSGIQGIKGRFQKVKSAASDVTAIIDYAHTPDALKNVLETINEIKGRNSKVFTVIGCGGDRDREKRPIMAQCAVSLSDFVILTSDNPRSEDPESILDDMEKGIKEENNLKYLRITDRKQAIKTACKMAVNSDIILIAGKGHENYQEIKGQRFEFDDLVIAKKFL